MATTMRFFILVVVSLMAAPCPAYAQAYCALRDPLSTLEVYFPERTSHRSFVREVRAEHQQAVQSTLPLAFRNAELGQHTLYISFQDADTLGYLHTRSEKGRFGLIEIAWVIGPELTIDGFEYQRCRDPSRSAVEASNLLDVMSGKSVSELSALVDGKGILNRDTLPSLTGHDRELAQSTLQSAIKTLLITELVWGDVI